MPPSRAGLLVFLATLHAAFGQTSAFTNADFELGQPGQTPVGWFVPRTLAAQGFTAKLTTNQPASGKMCAEVRWPTNGGVTADVFANLMQSIDATPWRGRRIKVTGAIRVASTQNGGRAQMWFRVDRPTGMGAFDNMGDRPVQRATWGDYSISAEIAEDATRLNLGLMTFGGATAWFDNVRFETLGRVTTLRDPPRPLDDAGLRNLVAFTRLLGYVRHYHPSDAAVSNDWLRFVVAALPKVESASDAPGLATELEAAFRTVAPTLRVFVTGKEPPPSDLRPLAGSGSLDVRFWEHEGYGQAASAPGMSIYRSERRTLSALEPASLPVYARPANTFRSDLGAGVSCAVPTALFTDASGTVPHSGSKPAAREATEVQFSVEHRGARLAAVMLTWNILQHFYPYFDVVGTDWDKELAIALRSAATDKEDTAFYRTLNRLVVQLHDGHGNLRGPGERRDPPIHARVELVEGKIVVIGVSDQTPDLKPGDIVERIEGRPAREVFDEIAGDISGATPQWRNHMAAFRFGPRPATAVAKLEVRGVDGSPRTVKVPCAFSRTEAAIHRPAKIEELKPGIYYVDVTRLKQAEFDEALPRLVKAKGIVFELRGYPTVEPAWLTHLSTKPLQSATWNVPKTHRPNRTDVEWETSRWNLPVGTPQLTTNRVFLIDGSVISYAESTMGIIEAYKLGAIVGEPTAGTNGNINPTDLPLGYKMIWTGMKVLKHDGSPHHGVGILPTVPVPRTIKGIREGQDEQLTRALSLVE